MTTTDQLAAVEARAQKYSVAYAKMLDLGGGVGLLGHHHPDMFEDMLAWDDLTENDHADTVLALLSMVREQQAKLGKIAEVIRDLSFDYDVDTPTVVDVEAIRAAITATEEAPAS